MNMTKLSDSKKRRINNNLIACLMILMTVTIIIFVVNIIKITTSDTGAGSTLATAVTTNEYANESYSIGNNPTEINKTYFKELNTAVDSEDPAKISEAVVKCFITEYYTWTNKDGNYDIGGMQYIFKQKQSDFAQYTLWNFYADMDLYITKYGTQNLMQVKDVTIMKTADAGTYTVEIPGDSSEVTSDGASSEATKESLTCIDVTAEWTYEDNTSIDTAEFQNQAVFHVVNNDGRWEIAGITAE
jgi:hypothetical protein